jgi:glutaredoxin
LESKELIVYGRSMFCPDLARTQRFLASNNVHYQQINIDQDEEAGARVEKWVGHRSVPTVVVARKGELEPLTPPTSLPTGRSARSVDRETVITEPSDEALLTFLQRHNLV